MYIQAARIGAPFGLQGGLHLYPYSEQREHLLELSCLYYRQDQKKEYEPLAVEEIKPHGSHLRAFFEDITDRDIAEKWVGKSLFINTDELPALPEGKFYWYQLEKLEVLTGAGESLGKVKRVYSNGPQDILVTQDQEQIPFVMGQTIHSVDLEKGHIVVLFDETSYDDSPEN